MTQLFRLEVGETVRGDGITTYMNVGEPVTVNGTPMVRLSHGTIVSATGFSPTRQQARLRAAGRIEDMGRVILAQAERLRSEEASDGQAHAG